MTRDSVADLGRPVPSAAFVSRQEEGIHQLGRDLGRSDEDVRAALGATPGQTAECLRPEELVNLFSLTPERLQHVSACRFCTEVKNVMDAAASGRPAAEFVGLATMPSGPVYSTEETCAVCGQSSGGPGLEHFLGRLGITGEMVDNLKSQFSNVDVDEYLNTARSYLKDGEMKATTYAKEHPAKVAAGVAALALGAGLLYAACRSEDEL